MTQMPSPDPVQIILPAHNEGGYIGDCLRSLLAQDYAGTARVIVVANGCSDDTIARAKALTGAFADRGWRLEVEDIPGGGKLAALNRGDEVAGAGIRLYLDADIRMSPGLLSGIVTALNTPEPRYAGGKLVVSASKSPISRLYARFWQSLPFVTEGVTGAGLFAVNAAGRRRWHQFPGIISDDTFVRLQFAETERVRVNHPYEWPIAQGFSRLVRVRRRQDNGVAEIASLYPDLMANHGSSRPDKGRLARLALNDPLGFVVYATVSVAVRLGRNRHDWARGR